MVAILASFVALDLASRLAAPAPGRARLYWLAGGALSLGTGIWSMHFIGMLAFQLPVPVRVDSAPGAGTRVEFRVPREKWS